MSATSARRPRWRHVLIVVLWAAGVLLGLLHIADTVAHAIGPTDPWQTSTGTLLDYRDLVVGPGQAMLAGENPYDPVAYLSTRPWAQEFTPYAPAWLLASMALGWLPLQTGAAIFLTVMAALMAHGSHALGRWVAPGRSAWVAPVIFIYLMLWPQSNLLGTSVLATYGAILVFSGIARRQTWLPAIGLALAIVKPQFGVPLLGLVLAMGVLSVAIRGVVLVIAASIVPLVMCVVAAGGPTGFIDSLIRLVLFSSSGSAPTGLTGKNMNRIDLMALAHRTGLESWVFGAAVASLVLYAAVLLLVRLWRLGPELTAAMGAPAIVALPIHVNYDFVFFLVSLAGAACWALRRPSVHAWVMTVLAAVPATHEYSSLRGRLGLTSTQVDILDMVIALLAGLSAIVLAYRWRRRPMREHLEAPAHA